jgi:serine/threonine protein kinase
LAPWTHIHQARSWSQATIWGLEWGGKRLAIKDFADNRNWLMRLFLSGWTIRKEARIYRRLHDGMGDSRGIPAFHGEIEGPALVMEWLPVQRLPKRGDHDLTPAFFDDLDNLLAGMHAAGVAHGDIRHKNIVLGEDGRPRLIDFTTAVSCPPGALWPRRAIFGHLAEVDRLTALRIRLAFFPDTELTAEQRHLLENEPVLHRLGRLLRQRVYRPFKKKVLRR